MAGIVLAFACLLQIVGALADSPQAMPSAAYRRAINQTRASLRARDLKAATRCLDRADQRASSAAEKKQIAQFRELTSQLEHFWLAVAEGWKQLEPTEELHAPGIDAIVVEVDAETLAVFAHRERHEYTPTTVPLPLAVLLAQRSANENAPTNQLFWGAIEVVEPGGDRARAEQMWKSAAAGGESVDKLLPFLKPTEIAIEHMPVPEPESLAAAQREVEKKLTDKRATSSYEKSKQAARLLTSALDTETHEQHWALLDRASNLASSASDVPLILNVIDQRAEWFDVAPWPLRSEAVAGAAKTVSKRDAASDLARTALKLSEAAQKEGHADQALALARSAETAAAKARDVELRKRAVQRRRELE